MQISAEELTSAKALCTTTELNLIQSSHGPMLEKADQTRLKKKISVARELRDKWRGLFERQRREVQQDTGSRVNESNQRSEEKIALFANALSRFEAQLGKLQAEPAPTKKPAKRKTPVKAQRVQSHRVSRARTKEELREHAGTKATPKKAAPRAAVAATPVKAKAATKSKLPLKKVVKKKAPTKGMVSAKATPKKPDLRSTASAKAAAKSTRLKMSGKDSRMQAHASSATKRSQAKRDTKRSAPKK